LASLKNEKIVNAKNTVFSLFEKAVERFTAPVEELAHA
jgi:hypothetical protein